MVICTEAMRKPKKAELRAVIRRALAARDRYFQAKQDGSVEILREDA